MLAAPPIGLCYVATAAEEAGHDVKVLDLCFAGKNVHSDLKNIINSFRPEVIGISIRNIDNTNMFHSVSYLPEVIELMKNIRKLARVPVVLGGSGASLMPESVLRSVGADYIVVSDGEESFCLLLDCIGKGVKPSATPGVGYFENSKFHITNPKHVDFRTPSPDIGRWIDTFPYQQIGSAYNVQTKRGCRQSCIYCTYNQSLEGNKLRLRPPVEVVDELEETYYKYKPKSFEFVDSVFNDPIVHSKAILEEIISRPWKAEFTAMGVHPKGIDDEYLNLMWRAGFRSFMITPESVSDVMLKNYWKSFLKDDIIKAAEAINRTSFAAWWFFMIGGPGETNDTVQESLDFTVN
ncbi:MAG: radical SAM protein, partial [Desulfomonilaceae bacterium]